VEASAFGKSKKECKKEGKNVGERWVPRHPDERKVRGVSKIPRSRKGKEQLFLGKKNARDKKKNLEKGFASVPHTPKGGVADIAAQKGGRTSWHLASRMKRRNVPRSDTRKSGVEAQKSQIVVPGGKEGASGYQAIRAGFAFRAQRPSKRAKVETSRPKEKETKKIRHSQQL